MPVTQQSANTRISDNYTGLANLRIINVDGTDFMDCHNGMQAAVEHAKSGEGPVLVHAQCIRIGAHSNSDRHTLYRSDEEIAAAEALDPLAKLRAQIIETGIMSEEDVQAMEAANEAELAAAAERVEASPDPDPETVETFLWADAWEPEETATPAEGDKWKLREAINETLHAEFTRNPNTFLWGQDVASKDKGGVFNLTKGMEAAFGPERVFNGPIAEDYIVGTANGMVRYRDDIRVVIEAAQFADYIWPAMEQIVEMSHEYWRTRGQFAPNVTLRLASGGYIGGGLYHSQNTEAIFGHLPGVRVVVPAFADDAAGLLRTCMRSEGMTFFLEPKFLYNQGFASTVRCDENHAVPFGKGRIRRAGTDATIVSWGTTVHWSIRAANKMAKEGYEVEVIDLRTVRPWDQEMVAESVRKTGRLLVVHEDHMTNGFGAEIVAWSAQNVFEYLDAPVARVAAKDIPIGFSKILERATLPYEAHVHTALESLLKY